MDPSDAKKNDRNPTDTKSFQTLVVNELTHSLSEVVGICLEIITG